MQKIRIVFIGLLVVLSSLPQNVMAFDFDHGNAAIEIVIPTVAPIIFTDISPTGGDATLVLRVTTLTTNAWFDATAPYHPTAVGIYSKLERRPQEESVTNKNMNIALLYASYHIFNSLIPQKNPVWRAMLGNVDLNPGNASLNPASPEGIGNLAGSAVVKAR